MTGGGETGRPATARVPARPAVAVERDLNRLAWDPLRERQRPVPLEPLAPIPASVGSADWGGEPPTE